MRWPPAPAPLGGDRLDVLGFGEPLVALQPPAGRLLESASHVELHVGGAELNVCAAVAALGGSAALCTRLGEDPLAVLVANGARRLGVELVAASDPERLTGVYFKDVRPDGLRRPLYYRAGSAASRLAPENADAALRRRPRAVVVSGLTAALGPGPRALVRHVGERAAGLDAALVVDVNLRRQLGELDEVVACLGDLLRLTGLLVVGTDEAEELFGTHDPHRVAQAARAAGCPEVVVKAGADGCWWMDPAGVLHHAPSAADRVVDPVGAGDAFTGGYLAARLVGAGAEAAAWLGSQLSAAVIAATGDTAGLPDPEQARRLLARVGPRATRSEATGPVTTRPGWAATTPTPREETS